MIKTIDLINAVSFLDLNKNSSADEFMLGTEIINSFQPKVTLTANITGNFDTIKIETKRKSTEYHSREFSIYDIQKILSLLGYDAEIDLQ